MFLSTSLSYCADLSNRYSIAIIFTFILFSSTTQAQFFRHNNTQSEAVGNAFVAVKREQAIWANPAGLIGSKTAFLLHSSWLYTMKDLRPISVGIVLPHQSGVTGITVSHFRFDNLTENTVGVVYARKLSSRLNAGIGLKYNYFKVNKYDFKSNMGFDLGFKVAITPEISIGFLSQNSFSSQVDYTTNLSGESTIQIQSIFRLGLSYQVNPNVLILSEIKKDVVHPVSFRVGLEYKAVEKLVVRGGFETSPMKMAFGLGYTISSNWLADITVSNHNVLGTTPSLGLSYFLKK